MVQVAQRMSNLSHNCPMVRGTCPSTISRQRYHKVTELARHARRQGNPIGQAVDPLICAVNGLSGIVANAPLLTSSFGPQCTTFRRSSTILSRRHTSGCNHTEHLVQTLTSGLRDALAGASVGERHDCDRWLRIRPVNTKCVQSCTHDLFARAAPWFSR